MKLLLLLIISFTFNANSQNYKQIKLFINNDFDLQTALTYHIDLEHSIKEVDGGIVLFTDQNELRNISMSGLRYEVLIDDWKSYYASLPAITDVEKKIIKTDSRKNFGVTGFDFGSMGGYYTFDEIVADLDEMFQNHPNLITEKFLIGTSIEGRSIWAVKISDNPNTNENEPSVGFDALVHAREPQSMATLMYFMWYLLENYGTDPQVTYLLNNREIYCVPCFNPDGYEYNRQTNPGGGGLWRKNRRNNGGCFGIDLNRNFGYMWGYDNIGSSPDPCDQTYRGSSAFSEPEAQAVRDLAILKNYGTHFNMHAYGNYYLYPWGYIDQETADSLSFREFASDMGSLSSYTFGTGPQLLGYPSNGSVRDWMYGEQTLKDKTFGYTIEIGNSTDYFWPQQVRIFPIAQENVKSNMYHAFVAGEYVVIEKYNIDREFYMPGDNVEVMPELRNKGIKSASNVLLELISPGSLITINNGTASLASIAARTSEIVASPLSFTILNSAKADDEIPLVYKLSINGNLVSSDTVIITVGFPVLIFADSTNNPVELWTVTSTPVNPRWEATTAKFFSPPTSFTDSKDGNYANNATVTMTLTNPINLSSFTNPRLTFQTNFNIEDDRDYGQVSVSTNNGSVWIPLEGKYTQPGIGTFQPNGEPVYDGVKQNWLKEEIKLTDYQSDQFKIRFQLRTDNTSRRDGWYLDDIGIFIYTVPTEIPSDLKPVYEFTLEQNFPNPFNPSTSITYSISKSDFVTLKVYDVLGNEVASLVNEEKQIGEYEIEFNGGDLSSGIYFYKLQAGNFVETKKMILLR